MKTLRIEPTPMFQIDPTLDKREYFSLALARDGRTLANVIMSVPIGLSSTQLLERYLYAASAHLSLAMEKAVSHPSQRTGDEPV